MSFCDIYVGTRYRKTRASTIDTIPINYCQLISHERAKCDICPWLHWDGLKVAINNEWIMIQSFLGPEEA